MRRRNAHSKGRGSTFENDTNDPANLGSSAFFTERSEGIVNERSAMGNGGQMTRADGPEGIRATCLRSGSLAGTLKLLLRSSRSPLSSSIVSCPSDIEDRVEIVW